MINKLNHAQLQAVQHREGPVLVLAGAGTGKTRVITDRIISLLNEGVSPFRIMAVTFTRKAANEMGERIKSSGVTISGLSKRALPWCGTFHSLALRFMSLNSNSNFSVLDEADSVDLIYRILEEQGAKIKKKEASVFVSAFSFARNTQTPLIKALENYGITCSEEFVANLYDSYSLRKKERQLKDFDDLLVDWAEALSNVNSQGQKFFDYILVDEYQDINVLQEEIIVQLARQTSNIMVVGDDAQSIYGFRGSCVENILSFADRYSNCKVIKLQENYRSYQPILDLSNALWNESIEGMKKDLHAVTKMHGIIPHLFHCSDEAMQSQRIITSIRCGVRAGIALKDQAVLFRSGFHAIKLELDLRKANIPYKKYGGRSIADAAHVKDLQAMLRAICSRKDEPAWMRFLRCLPGIGEKSAMKMFLKVSSSNEANPFSNFTKKEADAVAKFSELFIKYDLFGDASPQTEPPATHVNKVYELYLQILKENYDNAQERQKELEVFVAASSEYITLREFLNAYFLDEDMQVEDHLHGDNALTISTVHSAKGLEWRKVIIMNVVDRAFPAGKSIDSGDLEEERRLMYVAITRAKEQLELYWPQTRLVRNGANWVVAVNTLSCFITPSIKAFMEEGSVYHKPAKRAIYDFGDNLYDYDDV
ncbi:MAG: ATP-dependent helicase [Lentisphaeria bacterium]